MLNKNIEDISLTDLQALAENRIPEGRSLEYKRDHYGRSDEAKREFAADISAMANTLGGHVLIGVDEENGIASRIIGVEADDPDGLVRAVLDSARASVEPQILGLRVRWLEIESCRGVLIIQIERSWNAPHRVTVARDNRFFVRDENGKHPMSVTELRRAFLFGSELEGRIRQFRAERLQTLTVNEGPLAVDEGNPHVVLHLVPQVAFTDGVLIHFDPNVPEIPPLGASAWNSMYSLEGRVSYSGPEGGSGSVRAFSTLFRNGIVEAVAEIHNWEKSGRRSLALAGVEQQVIRGIEGIRAHYDRYSIPPPFYIMLSLLGVRGLSAPTDNWIDRIAYPHRSDRILLPEATADDLTEKAYLIPIHSLFDLMWNAFGQFGSPNFDRNGKYVWR